ncbi:hypothetical protein A2625_03230 [candidate division WOR-1 bacterium RIFCSPHIGHO2_01_FULL_53_15]|uniref:HaeII family restriction endonuclease n=1 Tax=candidate division WOR-1 bacterium RIFCSPHIGHO2_01_FULL_53_15 TaxID=1802564 RepID=A0A1F4Q3K9_UNCSA|nr:MAG: hypothetical protein A2625_03230 [candidate division WOR-1 bacterium RIFCSPHIGHO2_01_FULL_53_15]OGC12474.1 MAG: hypothetical protein A3D23_05650 [candidate division WOR-1 bacterium RIFCSPHIGHO2_02_FULL_53_26]
MATLEEAKTRLDQIIAKARIHLYKPIQIAEILYHHRKDSSFSLNRLESYRTKSKQWRDEISQKLVGRTSTSSARFQDNVFEQNAMTPQLLAQLGAANEKKQKGIVEAYIYDCISKRFETVNDIIKYIAHATTDSFNLSELIDKFITEPGLKRSIDKCYEIVAYALFDVIISHLGTKITLETAPSKRALLQEFEDFAILVLGLSLEMPKIVIPARIFRAGVTNAADRGIDIWSNFGPVIQIKHVALDQENFSNITDQVADNAEIIIVCKSAEEQAIKNVLRQTGLSRKIKGIVNQDNLGEWYERCISDKYARTLGQEILRVLKSEFLQEFPSAGPKLFSFLKERGYDRVRLNDFWSVD